MAENYEIKDFPSINFEERFKEIQSETKKIGQLTLDNTNLTRELLEDYNENIKTEILANSEEIDLEVFDLERQCIKFLASEQPVASDLLYVQSTVRVISHIKRMGYLDANIAEAIATLQDFEAPEELFKNLSYMADYVQLMIQKAIHAFLDANVDLASQLSEDDDKIDDLFDKILDFAVKYLASDDSDYDTKCFIEIIFIARHLERIADRAVAIGSRTIFMVTLKRPDNLPHRDEDEPFSLDEEK